MTDLLALLRKMRDYYDSEKTSFSYQKEAELLEKIDAALADE